MKKVVVPALLATLVLGGAAKCGKDPDTSYHPVEIGNCTEGQSGCVNVPHPMKTAYQPKPSS